MQQHINHDWRQCKMEHVCLVCGHIHDEDAEGAWDSLVDDFVCPECGCGKEDYQEMII